MVLTNFGNNGLKFLGTFGDTGSKYKNKYRSLTYNIKDLKNDGLFRRVLLKDLSPIEVVQMSADEYASKELQQVTFNQSEDSLNNF